MSENLQGESKLWKPNFDQQATSSSQDEGAQTPDPSCNNGANGSTSENPVESQWKPEFPSTTANGNNQGTTKPNGSNTSTPDGTQDPTSNNPGSTATNDASNNAKPTDGTDNSAGIQWRPGVPSTTTNGNNQGTTKPNGSNTSTSANTQDPTSNNAGSTATNGASNNAKPTNGTGNAAGSGGSSTGSTGGASTTKPGSNGPTTGGAQPQPTTTGTKPSSGGVMTNADPWAASSGKADDKGKYKSLAFKLFWEADICVLVVRFAGLVESPARGGSGGNPFSDASFVNSPQPASITAVKINYKTGIDRIQVRYGDKWAEPHGGSAGLQGLSEETFFLQRGETIVQVEGRSGTKLDSLQFTTSTGRKTQVYGGTGGYTFSWSGKKLAYISGRSGDQVDNLRSYWMA